MQEVSGSLAETEVLLSGDPKRTFLSREFEREF